MPSEKVDRAIKRVSARARKAFDESISEILVGHPEVAHEIIGQLREDLALLLTEDLAPILDLINDVSTGAYINTLTPINSEESNNPNQEYIDLLGREAILLNLLLRRKDVVEVVGNEGDLNSLLGQVLEYIDAEQDPKRILQILIHFKSDFVRKDIAKDTSRLFWNEVRENSTQALEIWAKGKKYQSEKDPSFMFQMAKIIALAREAGISEDELDKYVNVALNRAEDILKRHSVRVSFSWNISLADQFVRPLLSFHNILKTLNVDPETRSVLKDKKLQYFNLFQQIATESRKSLHGKEPHQVRDREIFVYYLVILEGAGINSLAIAKKYHFDAQFRRIKREKRIASLKG